MGKEINKIIKQFDQCLKGKDKGHHTPNFRGNEKKYLNECRKHFCFLCG